MMATKKNVNGTAAEKGWDSNPSRITKDLAHLEAMETQEPKTLAPIVLPKLDIRTLKVKLISDSGLICHRWSSKAKNEMLAKQMGKATSGKEPKDPIRDYKDSLYPHPSGGYGFPAIAFKNAAVSACTSLGKAVTKVSARQAFHVVGSLVKIEGEPEMREDMVRIGQGTADIRYRAEFPQWSTWIEVRYNARVLTAEQIINLFNTAGFAVGVGEWRSEKDGQSGLFHVATEEEVQ